MFSNLGVGDSEFRADVQFAVVVVEWLVVESAEDQLLRVVAMINANPRVSSATR